MAQDNLDEYLALLMARAEKKLAEEDRKEGQPEAAPSPAPADGAKEEPSQKDEAPAEEPKAPVKKKGFITDADKTKLEKEVGDLYVSSFTDRDVRRATKAEKRRLSLSRKALMDKENGKKPSVLKVIFRALGFLILVLLTILVVLYLLQLIADVTIIDLDAVWLRIRQFWDGLMALLPSKS